MRGLVEGEASHSLLLYAPYLYEAYIYITIFNLTAMPSAAIPELTEVTSNIEGSRRHMGVLVGPDMA